ncbi:uncharacterized protein BCR38DRAFT_19696 [Pseudomassariella vexata]|uniref:Uncharacterized protein n=1 Tax=Pseudomassariella vexata TaxID=1141098 RepID=A0A1Y2EJM8_9PEZI|nr:uncharacterized protein BCR38DRAFT_19696 [Pseudomassariella vexata]ORY71762.1 hypothetical protein BCR38DRAFT_19696 [Pseudomassariella vexata]
MHPCFPTTRKMRSPNCQGPSIMAWMIKSSRYGKYMTQCTSLGRLRQYLPLPVHQVLFCDRSQRSSDCVSTIPRSYLWVRHPATHALLHFPFTSLAIPGRWALSSRQTWVHHEIAGPELKDKEIARLCNFGLGFNSFRLPQQLPCSVRAFGNSYLG